MKNQISELVLTEKILYASLLFVIVFLMFFADMFSSSDLYAPIVASILFIFLLAIAVIRVILYRLKKKDPVSFQEANNKKGIKAFSKLGIVLSVIMLAVIIFITIAMTLG